MQQPDYWIVGKVVKNSGRLFLQDEDNNLWVLHFFDIERQKVKESDEVFGKGFVYEQPISGISARIEVGTLRQGKPPKRQKVEEVTVEVE